MLLGVPLSIVFAFVFAIIRVVGMFVLTPVGALVRYLFVDTVCKQIIAPLVTSVVKYILEPICGATWGAIGSNSRSRSVLHVDTSPEVARALSAIAGGRAGPAL